MACASAGAFATTIIGLPSEVNVTETELVTTALTVKLPDAPTWRPVEASDEIRSNMSEKTCANIGT